MNATLAYTETLVVTVCTCGIHFAVPDRLLEVAREGTRLIYCPSCKASLSWEGRTREQKLREQLEQERDWRASANARADRERARADENEKRRIAQKAATTRARKRAGAGVCPCCNRTFKQLARHMQTKHPDFDPENSARDAVTPGRSTKRS